MLANEATGGDIRSRTYFTYLSSNPVGQHSYWISTVAVVSSWLAACTNLSSFVAKSWLAFVCPNLTASLSYFVVTTFFASVNTDDHLSKVPQNLFAILVVKRALQHFSANWTKQTKNFHAHETRKGGNNATSRFSSRGPVATVVWKNHIFTLLIRPWWHRLSIVNRLDAHWSVMNVVCYEVVCYERVC